MPPSAETPTRQKPWPTPSAPPSNATNPISWRIGDEATAVSIQRTFARSGLNAPATINTVITPRVGARLAVPATINVVITPRRPEADSGFAPAEPHVMTAERRRPTTV